jgi:catechol 2,3-dioxygenase-like lactoylglutathione lyase family enzyme
VLSSPSHVAVGCTDLDATTRFLQAFGFQADGDAVLPAGVAAALYGADGPLPQRWLSVPQAARGRVRLVQAASPRAGRGPFDRGAHAIDLYTTDIARSVEQARQAGGRAGPTGSYRAGPLQVHEVKTHGPDGLALVFIQVDRRRPSVLDSAPDRLHSEVHSIVWTVDGADMEAALAFWRDTAGLSVLLDATLADPQISMFMELPRDEVTVRLALLADADVAPARLELLTFPDDRGAPPATTLHAGSFLPGFTVDDLDATMGRLRGATFGEVAALPGGGRAVRGVAPGGVAFELLGTVFR